MMALLRSELRRATSRRLVRLLLVAAVVGIAAGAVITAVDSKAPPPGTLAAARAEYGFAVTQLPDVVLGSSFLVIIAGWLLGASFAGAEWHAGTMATLLTWEPRRTRVLAAKVVATAAVVAALALVVLILMSLSLWLVAATRGITEGAGEGFVADLAGAISRVAAAAVVASLIGLSIAMIGRNTSAGLGIGFAYLGVVEGLIRGLRPSWTPFLFGENVAVFVSGDPEQLGAFPDFVTRTVAGGALVAVVYAVTLLFAAGWSFRARDVN